VYIGAKVKACEEIGINGVHLKLPPTTTQEELIENIERLNEDPTVHGIILQVILRVIVILPPYFHCLITTVDVSALRIMNRV
jgi:hypothetical protein